MTLPLFEWAAEQPEVEPLLNLEIGDFSVRDVKPFVKWAGGKRRLMGELLARLPQSIEGYFEPFAGGAALFWALPELAQVYGADFAPAWGAPLVLSDANRWLINTYWCVRDRLAELLDVLCEFNAYDNGRRASAKAMYLRVRDAFNSEIRFAPSVEFPNVHQAARLLIMNRRGFNGLWRVNSGGRFNVPFGQHATPPALPASLLHACSQTLQGVKLLCGDFADAVARARSGDFVFFDPPYDPGPAGGFTGYVAGGFDWASHERLAETVFELTERGVHVMLTNADTARVRELYSPWIVESLTAPRSIAASGGKRKAALEVVVRNYGAPL